VHSTHREDLHGDVVRLGTWITKCRADAARLTAAQLTALNALDIDVQLFKAPPPAPGAGPEDDAWWDAPAGLTTPL
jgi:hypothetical protein